jgi:hypothetical protein
MWIYNNINAPDPGLDAHDGEARDISDFKDPTTPNIYTNAGWDFADVWKWLHGWDYPVLKWQNAAPGAGMEAADVEVEIEWL